MSAIFGVLGVVSAAELAEMGGRMTHRGADVSWTEVTSRVYLGRVGDARTPAVFTRDGLSAVIDLSSAAADETAEADLFASFAASGLAGLETLKAPFAVAAWDDRSRRLLLARDFVGQKPLHYCALPGGGMAFATEYKALLALKALPAEPDLNALQYMQCYKRTPPGRTLLRGVHTVAPGAIFGFSADGEVQSREFMPLIAVDVRPSTEEAIRDRLVRRIGGAMEPFVDGRTRVGISLSGGIDSIAVAFLCRRIAPQAELVGFTAGNDDEDPEIRTAAIALDRLGGRHQPVIVGAGSLVESLPEAVWHFENPVGRTEAIQWLELGRAARRDGFDWLFSGVGGDSLFGGMPKHKLLWLSQVLPPLRKDLLEFYTLTQSGRRPERPVARLMDLAYFRGAVPPVPRIANARYTPELPGFPRPGPEFLNQMLTADMQDSLARGLVRLERSFQASGVDFVSPYFDRDVMAYAFTIASRLKIKRGAAKYILRQAMRSVVSAELLDIPKGITRIRQDRSFAEILGKLVERYLDEEQVRRRGWFVMDDIRNIERRLRQKRYHTEAAMRLWTVIVTELWARIYLDHRGQRPSRF